MMIININSKTPKIIGNEAYLRTRGPSRLSKDHGPKKHPNTRRKKKPNIYIYIYIFVKMEDQGAL